MSRARRSSPLDLVRAVGALGRTCAVSVAIQVALGSTQVRAQQATQVADAVSFALPESPAATYLGITPAKVTRPTTGRSLGVSLADGIDEQGKVKQGLAFEFAPFIYLANISLRAYQDNPGAFIRANLNVSLATAKAAGDSASTDIALGVRLVPLDRGDPLRDKSFTGRIATELGKCAPPDAPAGGPPRDYDQALVLQCMRGKTDSLARAWARAHWNSSSLAFAMATGLRLAESQLNRSTGTGVRGWGVFGQQLGGWGQAIVSAAYTYHRHRVNDSTYHSGSLGVRLLAGHSRFNAFVEGVSENRFEESDFVDRTVGSWSGGMEFLATNDLWVSTGFGGTYGRKEEPERVIVFANVRWGISSKARLAP